LLLISIFSRETHRPSEVKLWHIPQKLALPSPFFVLARLEPLDEQETSYFADSVNIFSRFSSNIFPLPIVLIANICLYYSAAHRICQTNVCKFFIFLRAVRASGAKNAEFSYYDRKHEKGANMFKSIQLDLPYPSLDCISCDLKSAKIVFPAYASAHSELSAVLQYLYHSFIFKGRCDDETADILIGIAITEMHHLDILGNMLLKLGADPVYVTAYPPNGFNFFSASAISYSKSVRKMLMDDLAGELCAIENYDKILCKLCNEEVSAVIARIKLDEELHVRVLKERMNALFCDIR